MLLEQNDKSMDMTDITANSGTAILIKVQQCELFGLICVYLQKIWWILARV